MEPRLALTCTAPARFNEAKSLAHRLHLPFLSTAPPPMAYDFLLVLTPDYLGLIPTHTPHPVPFYIDFLAGKLHYRHQQAHHHKELLAKAIGLKASSQPFIVDATAGLGRDSFILAALGYRVTLLERSPIVHALLQDALLRAQDHPSIALLVEKLHLIHADALTWLGAKPLPQQPEVIYLDPMFPPRKKSAAVKKEMVILQSLLPEENDTTALFELALTCATKRVVVKRPRLAPIIAKHTPSFSVTGKSSRFDIYLIHHDHPIK